MATLIWTGATNGNFTTAGNFLDASTLTTPGSPPANSDTVIFDRGVVDVDAGLTAALTGIVLIGTQGYKGRVGPTAALQIACASIRWDSGWLNLHGAITVGNIKTRRGTVFTYTSGTATNVYTEGDVSIEAAAVVTNIRSERGMVTALANGTGFTKADMRNGAQLHSRRSGTFLVGQGGRVRLYDAAAMSTGTIIEMGGTIIDGSSADAAGTVEVYPTGTLDLSLANDAKTIPTLARWPRANVNLYTLAGAATVTSLVQYGLNEGNFDAMSPSPL